MEYPKDARLQENQINVERIKIAPVKLLLIFSSVSIRDVIYSEDPQMIKR